MDVNGPDASTSANVCDPERCSSIAVEQTGVYVETQDLFKRECWASRRVEAVSPLLSAYKNHSGGPCLLATLLV